MSVRVKVELPDGMCKLCSCSGPLDHAALRTSVSRKVPDLGRYKMCYVDEDGDKVEIDDDDTLKDAIRKAGDKMIKIVLLVGHLPMTSHKEEVLKPQVGKELVVQESNNGNQVEGARVTAAAGSGLQHQESSTGASAAAHKRPAASTPIPDAASQTQARHRRKRPAKETTTGSEQSSMEPKAKRQRCQPSITEEPILECAPNGHQTGKVQISIGGPTSFDVEWMFNDDPCEGDDGHFSICSAPPDVRKAEFRFSGSLGYCYGHHSDAFRVGDAEVVYNVLSSERIPNKAEKEHPSSHIEKLFGHLLPTGVRAMEVPQIVEPLLKPLMQPKAFVSLWKPFRRHWEEYS